MNISKGKIFIVGKDQSGVALPKLHKGSPPPSPRSDEITPPY